MAAAEVEEDFERMELMIDAIFDDNIIVVEQMIQEEDFDVNTRDKSGRTPLIWAVVQGREKIVDFLLANGANIRAVDEDGMSAIWSIIRTIHQGGLLRDRLNNHINIINALGRHDKRIFNLQNSLTSNTKSILHYALELKVDLKVIKALISAGAPVDAKDSKGNTILVPALENLKMTETLLELVDDESEKEQMINSRNKKGETPLLTLLRLPYIYIDEDKVKLLIEHGADVRIPDNSGITPILAAEEVYTDMQEDFAAQKQEQEQEPYYSDEDENDRNARIDFENKPMMEQLESMRIIINTLEASLEAWENRTRMSVFKQKKNMARIPIVITESFLRLNPRITKAGVKTKKRKKGRRNKSRIKKGRRKMTHRMNSRNKKGRRKKVKGRR